MNRKNSTLFFIGCIVTIVIISFGNDYAKKQEKELFRQEERNRHTAKLELEKEATDKEQEKMALYEENRQTLSLMNYMTLVQHKNDLTKVVFYGDNYKSEKWTESVEAAINEHLGKEIKMNRLYFPGYDSEKLIAEEKAAELVAVNADVVFFMLPIIENQKSDFSLDASKESLLANYKLIKEELPDSLVLLITPTPSSILMEEVNSRTLDYTNYIDNIMESALQEGIPFMNLHQLYLEKLVENNLSLEETLGADGKRLNDVGTNFISEIVVSQLNNSIDTSTGMP